MALDYPNSPTNGQQFTGGAGTWQWDGTKWVAVSAPGGPYLPLTGGTVSGSLTVSGAATHSSTTAFGGAAYLQGHQLWLAGAVGSGNGNLSGDASNIAMQLPTGNGTYSFLNNPGTAILTLAGATQHATFYGDIAVNGPGISYSNSLGANDFAFGWNGALWSYVGGTQVGQIQFVTSDARLKTDIAPMAADCLGVIGQIPLYQFDWLPVEVGEEVWQRPHWSCGFTAQDIAGLIPEAVTDSGETLGVDLMPLVAHLIGALQQLTVRLEALEGAR
jgi:hypothetical protein